MNIGSTIMHGRIGLASYQLLPLNGYPLARRKMITQNRLMHLLDYNPDTGLFTWLRPTSNRVTRGEIAGSVLKMKSATYTRISLDGGRYQAHRLAFLYMEGKLPPELTDHKDGNGQNNKWSNLRKATRSENNKNANMRSHNTSGYNGVGWCKQKKKWQAIVTSEGTVKHLGFFANKNDAIEARHKVNEGLGFTDRHGFNGESSDDS
jgi:hypothetical protein